MKEKNVLVQKIVEGIQERKGKKITVVNLSKLDAPARYFVLCEGTSNTQILAITESVKVYVRENTGESPFAMDYGDVMVHIFERETRQFYNLEHLWADAKLTDVPDME